MAREFQISGEQYFDEYILVAPGSDYGRAMWSDIERISNATILEKALKPCGKFLEVVHHIHFSFALNKITQLPFQNIWKKLYSLESIGLKEDKKYCVIYTDVSAARTDLKYLAGLRAQTNITLVLVMVNTMARRGSLIEKRKGYFDIVFSFDRNDCDKYGFIYHPTYYSMTSMKAEDIVQDAFYVGVSKGRASIITAVYERLMTQGAKAEFFISGLEPGEQKRKGIHYNQWLKYRQVLDYISKSNCIVEIMDGNQEGVTLRTMEAVCYNKRLLTNNASMKQSKYYTSGYIQVFDRPEDIDVDFVKDRSKVDYCYDGEFSPVHLLEHINKTVQSV